MITKSQKAILHIAKAELGLDDGTYREMLFAWGKVRSSKDLNSNGYAAVLAHLKKSGFKMRTRKQMFKNSHRPGMASDGQIRKIYALWWTLSGSYYESGKEFSALRAFLRARFRVDHENFLTPEKAHQVIEALKKIGVREQVPGVRDTMPESQEVMHCR
jgi:phage gp16-like protein